MTVCPPPWEGLTAECISRRLAALDSLPLSSSDVRRCFGRDGVFSTGNASIDRLLPDGGVAFGTMFEIFGPPAAGKSRLVRQMVTSFAVRGGMEWTMARNGGAASDQQQSQEKKEEVQALDDDDRPRDWCVFLLLSDPSSLRAGHLRGLLREALVSASASRVQGGDHLERLEELLLQKVKVLFFMSPNDLLAFFRFLYSVEYYREGHHERRRRVLVAVDSLARLWEHPACGAGGHARHWMAAELVREVRNAIIIGNGWRGAPDDGSRCGQQTCDAPLGGHGPHAGGSMAAVFVNGCTNVHYQRGALRPLGLPVWHAAAADVQLFVEPLSPTDAFLQHSSEANRQQSFDGTNILMRARVVKGGDTAGREVLVE